MDVHPAGVPHLVGPEGGSGFSQFDFSAQFRVLPGNLSSDTRAPNLDSLSTTRTQMQGLYLHATSPRSQPIRMRDDYVKPSSPRLYLSSHDLALPYDTNLLLGASDIPEKHVFCPVSLPDRFASEEVDCATPLLAEGESNLLAE